MLSPLERLVVRHIDTEAELHLVGKPFRILPTIIGQHRIHICQPLGFGIISTVGDTAVILRVEQAEVAGRLAVYPHLAVDSLGFYIVAGYEGIDICICNSGCSSRMLGGFRQGSARNQSVCGCR